MSKVLLLQVVIYCVLVAGTLVVTSWPVLPVLLGGFCVLVPNSLFVLRGMYAVKKTMDTRTTSMRALWQAEGLKWVATALLIVIFLDHIAAAPLPFFTVFVLMHIAGVGTLFVRRSCGR